MNYTMIKKTLFIFMLLLPVILQLHCYTYKFTPEEHKDHVENFPAGEKQPIDGIWKDAWGNKFEINAGRIIVLDGLYPSVNYYDIKRVSPGRYTAKNVNIDSKHTISVVEENRIIIREPSYDQVLTSIGIFDPAKFEEEVKTVMEEANRPRIVIHDLSCKPKKMKPETPFKLQCTYTLHGPDADAEKLPVSFSYQISDTNRTLFRSKPSSFNASNHVRSQRVANLKASKEEGFYWIRATLNSGQLHAVDSCAFVISRDARYPDDRPLVDRLVGKYKIEGDGQTRLIVFTKEGNSLVPKFVIPNSVQMDKVRHECRVVSLTQDRMVLHQTILTSFDEYNVFNPSTVSEITIDLSDPLLEELPVRTKILQSNFLGTGTTFRSTMIRIEEQ